jgi:hypothetical protein
VGLPAGRARTVLQPHLVSAKGQRMAQKQLLHLVLGGELSNIEDVQFKDLDQVEIVGLFPNYASAHAAWKAKAQRTVDNAHMRYFIVHLHRLLDPDTDVTRQQH